MDMGDVTAALDSIEKMSTHAQKIDEYKKLAESLFKTGASAATAQTARCLGPLSSLSLRRRCDGAAGYVPGAPR